MAVPRCGRLYALTSLQIGDVQSYVSRLFLLVAYEGLKLVFLVDNDPWTGNSRRSRPAELWQLMVTKSRGSPFSNRSCHYSVNDKEEDYTLDMDHQRVLKSDKPDKSDLRLGADQEKADGWLSLLIALQRSCKERARSKKPSHGLHGCVAFEVAWTDVRGINYLNELQTDTCVSLEVRAMVKREFDSLEQAQACYSTYLPGTDDTGPSLNISKFLSGKSGKNSINVSFSGRDHNVGRLDSGMARGADNQYLSPAKAEVQIGSKRSGEFSTPATSGRVGEKRLKKVQLEETNWPSTSRGGSASVTGENGMAYDDQNDFKRTNQLKGEQVSSYVGYTTPPSSPLYGQAIDNRSNCRYSHSRPFKEFKKSKIWPLEMCDGEIKDCGDGGRTLSDPGCKYSTAKSKTFLDHISLPGSASKNLEKNRSFGGCFRCRLVMDDSPVRSSQHCHKCCGSSEGGEGRVYGHPARLIAPAEVYRDTLILFRFSEPLLPFELQRIITADRRLLKMLESGLPSWVVFMQSYPILCKLYRPWMRPFCGTIYYLVSVITVLIGFYDLYKNVPILKATASRICGPLFEMIEDWGMVSRLKYLGTMLFLQNCEKAFKWGLAFIRYIRQISTLMMRPVIGPLTSFGETFQPLWDGVVVGFDSLAEFSTMMLTSVAAGACSILSLLLWPLLFLLNALWFIGATILYPMFAAAWGVLVLPVQMARSFASLVRAMSSEIVDGIRDVGSAVYTGLDLFLGTGSSAAESVTTLKSSTPSPSMWRTLWNDIFSKIFHSVGSILKGLVAFFTACNRHRLSIYNHMLDFVVRVGYMVKSGQVAASTACRQIFPMPEYRKTGTQSSTDEGNIDVRWMEQTEPEAHVEQYIHTSTRDVPGLKFRFRGESVPTPLLLIKSDSTSPRTLERRSCHLI